MITINIDRHVNSAPFALMPILYLVWIFMGQSTFLIFGSCCHYCFPQQNLVCSAPPHSLNNPPILSTSTGVTCMGCPARMPATLLKDLPMCIPFSSMPNSWISLSCLDPRILRAVSSRWSHHTSPHTGAGWFNYLAPGRAKIHNRQLSISSHQIQNPMKVVMVHISLNFITIPVCTFISQTYPQAAHIQWEIVFCWAVQKQPVPYLLPW